MLFKGSKKGWERIDEVDFDLWDLEKFQGKILVAGGDEGILSIENKKLVPFKEGISVSGIKVIEDTLFGFDINTLHKFDGKNWDTRKFDFSQVIINT
ncbi:MAG: hypothetical protein D6681_11220 [Calditrichaeota bacterium]|nr:MAG: hypothetical protein D6681_11220 [Calditrichota bacterium]